MIWLSLIAVIVVLIWGGTFVNSKVLLLHGMTPEEIFTIRFLLAYLCTWCICKRRLWCASWRDELLLLLAGVTGGSLYFLSENIAVGISLTTNVSFIVCTTPLLTALLGIMTSRSIHASRSLIVGSVIALAGTATIIFNGQITFRLNPLGDLLAWVASLCWAVYSLLIRKVSGRYDAVFITRKVFGYGLLTILPVYLIRPWQSGWEVISQPIVWGNLLYLGVVASFICFVVWSWVLVKMGTIKASNFIYLNPISTVVISAIVLQEPYTWLSAVGSALVLVGVYVANRNVNEFAD